MSFQLVLFGGTGDLAWRKILPALFQAYRHNSLPRGGQIIGVSRDSLSDDQFRQLIGERMQHIEGEKRPQAEEFSEFAKLLHYQACDLSNTGDYVALKNRLDKHSCDVRVMYLATAPQLFTTICENLATQSLNTANTRIVLEKPLGQDLQSNQEINSIVKKFFSEKQIFRIDHYLGKPSVQNLFALRFGNSLFEPIWRRETVSSIQITLAEEIGIASRGPFYERTGALKDMIQNHALQLLCAIAMEPPINTHADAIRDEKLKVLRSLKPWTVKSLKSDIVRGQYSNGVVQGHSAVGYTQEEGVRADSTTETFVALKTEVSNWRWAGVPFFIRTGKRLARQDARIVINFRPTPHPIFQTPLSSANRLTIHLQPLDGMALHLFAQGPAQISSALKATHHSPKTPLGPLLSPVELNLDFEQRFGSDRVGAYERLLLDALAGRLNLFVRSDEQEAAWSWVEPIIEDWRKTDTPLHTYPSGSWGPIQSKEMIEHAGHHWDDATKK
jgi:glucose-6-phosphate 1-dehydrogenase